MFLWGLYGGQHHDFVGLRPLHTHEPIMDYINIDGVEKTKREIEILHEEIKKGENPTQERSRSQSQTWNRSQSRSQTWNKSQSRSQTWNKSQSRSQTWNRSQSRSQTWNREDQDEQEMCRRILEKHYNKRFVKVRQPLLLNCYNEELQLAVEYLDKNHYVWPNNLSPEITRKQFISQIQQDKKRLEICNKNNIYLITVPYHVPQNKIYDYLMHYLPENAEYRESEEFEESD